MGADKPGSNPARDAKRDSAVAAVPFIARKLDELYEALKVARYSQSLLQAKQCLESREFAKALGLVQSTRELVAQAPRPRETPKPGMLMLHATVGPDVLPKLNTVIGLLEPLRDWEQQHPKTAPAPAKPAASGEGGVLPAIDPEKQRVAAILEPAAFTQLLTATQQCGLVQNADAIISVRDREFPARRYQRAFDMIEAIYQQLNAGATRRQSELRREEMRYKAGTLRMSPKEWLARQQRVNDQNQKIERARRYFARVLDGLRLLRATVSGEGEKKEEAS